MSFNPLEAAKGLLSDDLIAKTAVSLGENELNIRRALKGAIPAVLAGLLHQSSRTDISGITDLLKNVAGSGSINNLTDLLDVKKNSSVATTNPVAGFSTLVPGWLKALFGGKLINIINAISIYADVKSSSATAILNMAVPVALTPIAQYAQENNLNTTDIGTFLQSQKSSIINAVPSGFNLTGSLGIDSLNDIGTTILIAIPTPAEHYLKTAKSNFGKWVWPLLLLITFGGLVWFFAKKGSKSFETTTTYADTTTTPVTIIPPDTTVPVQIQGKLDSVTGNYIYDQGTEIELTLPDSTFLITGANSTEARLFDMLNNTNSSIDTLDTTKNRVTFDRVYFKTGQSTFTTGSRIQLKNIATILKNFPASSIKIGAYTDNGGDSVINKKISEKRAKIVMQELIKLGVGANQVTEAVGYGPEHPVCVANDTPECKAQNKRVDLKIVSK